MLKTLTYTSDACGELDGAVLERIHRSALTLNPLDGITGLLVFNGSSFLQLVEGSLEAVDALVDRLRADARHANFVVRDERFVEDRSFPDWTMALVRVSVGRFDARVGIERVLPPTVSEQTRSLILAMSDLISR